MIPRILLLLVVALAGPLGCARDTEPLLEPLPLAPGGAGVAQPRLNGTVSTPAVTQAPRVSLGTPPTIALPREAAGDTTPGDISLDFADTDIREVVAQVLGNILRVNYAIDPAVRGTATLRTVRPLNRSQLLPTLQALLGQNGATLLQSGGLYRIVPAAAAAGIGSGAGGDVAAGSTPVPLRYASAEDLAKVLQPFVGPGTRIAADPGRNVLLVSGDPNGRQSLLALVAAFDVDVLAGQSYALLPVSSGDARDFAMALQDAVRGQGGAAMASTVRVIPMQRINAVLVVASQPRIIDGVRRVFALVEQARRSTIRGWSVYYLQNSRSNDMAFVLQQAFTPRSVTAQPSVAGAIAPGRATQGLNSGRGTGAGGGGGNVFGGGGASGNSGLGSGLGQGRGLSGSTPSLAQGGTETATRTPAASANPLLGGLEPGSGEEGTPDSMRIIPNVQSNALLIYATQQERDSVELTLRRLDILPLQVRIDATIAEVTLNDQLQYGTQFFFRSGDINAVLSTATGLASVAPAALLATNFPGFVLSGNGGNGAPVAISALQAVTNVRVLSSPQLMVLDNEPARLQVGQLVPFLTQSAQSTLTTGAPIVSSVDYRETGVILDVTPRVNSGGLVTLDISQEVSDVVAGQTTTGLNSPTFSQRAVRSRVAVQDGQTIGLAGLIRDSDARDNSGLPWLRNIPVLGSLFSTQSNQRQRTELIVLITPRVIHDQRDARALTEDLRDRVLNAAAVPDQLQALPPSGPADPQLRVRRRLGLER